MRLRITYRGLTMTLSSKVPTFEQLRDALRLLEVPAAAPLKNPYSRFYRERAINDRTVLARIRAKGGLKKRHAKPSKYS